MKNGLSHSAVERLSGALRQTCSGFDSAPFSREALQGLEKLELKERVFHFIETLHRHLPKDFEEAADILHRIPSCWDVGKREDPLAKFAAWPLIDYVGVYGLNHPKQSLPLLGVLTPLFSAEFAIRPFIEQHTELTVAVLSEWCAHPNPHVRRLVSEGTRPRLPWASRLRTFEKDPVPTLALLESLKDDPSDYVRRSVANHLNDLSKDHPDRVLTLCNRWKTSCSKEREWILRHATRSLVKAGHPKIFPLLGYTDDPKITVSDFQTTPKKIQMGSAVEFSAKITSDSEKNQIFVVDYALHLLKKNGRHQAKVFKLKSIKLPPQQTLLMTKRHPFKPISTRTYYSGEQCIELLINGISAGKISFYLNV